MSSVKRVLVCDRCHGIGVFYRDELVNYHKNEYVSWTEECLGCKGSGLVQETTTVTHEPYSPMKPVPRCQ